LIGILSSFRLALFLDPLFKPRDGVALGWRLDVGVNRVHFLAARMAHQGLADFLHHPGFEQPGVEAVAQVVEAEMPDAGLGKGGLPGPLDGFQGLVVVEENQTLRLTAFLEKHKQALGQRNLPRLTLGGLRTGYREQHPPEVNVLPSLAQ
jgi:hypothetical protein